jgi:hypothetical protein
VRNRYLLLPLLTLCWLTGDGLAAEPDPEISEAEKTLKDAHIATDDAALLKYFQDHVITDAEREKLVKAIAELGDDSFDVRERAEEKLIKAGPMAFALLMAAQNSRDPEVASRARTCLEKLDHASDGQRTIAAARLLAHRNPKGASATLLEYVPFADDEYMQDAIFAALAKVCLKDGKADDMIRTAAESKVAVRRSAAAYVLSRAGDEDRKLAIKLLQDTDAPVRFQAATGLLRAGVKDAVPELMRLLTDAPSTFAYQAEDLLYRIAGDKPPAASLGKADDAGRKKAREAWEAWWKTSAENIDLAKINIDNALKGITVIVDFNMAGKDGNGRVWECSKEGKKLWEIGNGLGGPVDARMLANGHVLIAEHNANQVTERDREGKILWTQTTQGNPVSCQRLTNGNTLISTTQQISEVTRDNKEVWKLQATGGLFWTAYKGKDGKILCAESAGNVVELDAAGKRLRSVSVGGMQSWGGVEQLPNGNLLVAKYDVGQVVEVDWSGKVVWQANAPGVTFASRQPNGNVLVSNLSGRSVSEIDRNGKEVWKQATEGQPFRTWRY